EINIPQRNREATIKKLIEATGKIITREGFTALGINNIAAEAGVSKVLIYRYFGDLNGLIKEYAISKDYWLTEGFNLLEQTHPPLLEIFQTAIIGQVRYLRNNPDLQEMMRWELSEKNEVTEYIAKIREERSTEMLEKLKRFLPSDRYDLSAIATLLTSGIMYLILRSKTVQYFNGIDITSEEGWQRIENAARLITELLLQASDQNR
ncbi:MAG: TetR/AcrR family transcriptional regulator, partial [Bacteroidota bacterium]|nr:TetR/AcrR family transcriptional regulator [Bacteroidota bacterium]